MIGRTKIVATIGPASSTPEMLRQLIDAGVSVFRLNFSHGTHDEHSAVVSHIRSVSRAVEKIEQQARTVKGKWQAKRRASHRRNRS